MHFGVEQERVKRAEKVEQWACWVRLVGCGNLWWMA